MPEFSEKLHVRNFRALLCGVSMLLCLISPVTAQSPARIAIVPIIGDDDGRIAAMLRASGKNLNWLESEMVAYAVRGAGYEGNLNFSRDEARAFGLSLGCDFYLLGKVQNFRRLGEGDLTYYESLAGIYLVESRTGRLIHFAWEQARASSATGAYEVLKQSIATRAPELFARLVAAQDEHLREIKALLPGMEPPIEILPEAVSESSDERQPFFYQRLKPAYTEQAELAGITATVELEAEFLADGHIGQVEIVRWAGYGLEESAIKTLRQLRFKPASRDGKEITIRGLVRYNFGRVPPRQTAPAQAAPPKAGVPSNQKDIERLKQSLQNIMKAGKILGNDPNSQKPE
jgi:TonB family protein